METPLGLLVCVISCVVAGVTRDPPVFSKRYTTKGILYIPSDIKVVEPFQAWFDGVNNKSRVDYHNGALKTFQFPFEGNHGTAYKFDTQRSFIFKSKSTCVKVDGTTSSPVNLQKVLPDFTGFKFIEERVIDGHPAERWERIEDSTDVFSKYTMWVRRKGNLLRSPVPVLYEVKRQKKVLNDTIDKYSLNFTQYSTDNFKPKVFRLPSDRNLCRDANMTESTKVDINPMLEFTQGEESHILEAFKKFKRDFKKKYSSNEEELIRFNNFKSNYRFIQTTNRANRSYQLDVNQFTDLSVDEVNQMILQRKKAALTHIKGTR